MKGRAKGNRLIEDIHLLQREGIKETLVIKHIEKITK